MPSETWGLPFFVSHPCSVAGWSLQPACGKTDNLRHGDLQRALLEPQGQREEKVLTAGRGAGRTRPSQEGAGKETPCPQSKHSASGSFPELSPLFLNDWRTLRVTLGYSITFFITKVALLLKSSEIQRKLSCCVSKGLQ